MNYRQATEYLFSLKKGEMRLGLEGMAGLLGLMGNPQDGLRCIHVAGTNGKGSVCAMLASVLRAAGCKVGLYTSPHLRGYTERIMVDGRRIPKREVVRLLSGIAPLAEQVPQHPSFFEITTALAFRHFAEQKVDYAVVETGLGGRLDATNAVRPLVSVITNIGLDHVQVLGGTIGAIAREKAGIIKPGVPVVTAATGEALAVIEEVCREKGCRLVRVDRPSDARLGLAGEHQRMNASTAVAALGLLGDPRVTEAAVRKGLRSAKWPGRLELLGNVLLDGAHNAPAIAALRESLPRFRRGRLVLVLGILKDKAYPEMMREIAPLADAVILTRPSGERAATPQELESEIKKYSQNYVLTGNVAEALEKAGAMAGPDDLVLVTGSLYTVGEARDALLNRKADAWKDLSESSLRVG